MSGEYRFTPWKIQDRKEGENPFRFRWRVGDRVYSESFHARALAESFRAELIVAARNGESFDRESGLPESKRRAANDVTCLQHMHEFLNEHWKRSAPKSRVSFLETFPSAALVLFRDRVGRPDDDTLRRALRKALNKGDNAPELNGSERAALEWAERASQPIGTLNDSDVVMDPLGALATRLDGTPAAPDYYSRRRRSMRTLCSFRSPQKATCHQPAGQRQPSRRLVATEGRRPS